MGSYFSHLCGAKNAVLVRTSVVAEDVPLLISSRALKTLGRLVDLDRDLYHFKRLRTTAAWATTATGHIGFHILVGNDMMLAQLVSMDWEAFAADLQGHEGYMYSLTPKPRVH